MRSQNYFRCDLSYNIIFCDRHVGLLLSMMFKLFHAICKAAFRDLVGLMKLGFFGVKERSKVIGAYRSSRLCTCHEKFIGRINVILGSSNAQSFSEFFRNVF